MNEDMREKAQKEKMESEINKEGNRKAKENLGLKFLWKKVAPVLVPILVKLSIPAILVFIVIAGGWSIIKDYSENNASAEASYQAIQSKEIVDIAPSDDGDGYYFKISPNVVEKYLEELNKAYYNGYYNMQIDRENLEEDGEYDDIKFDESDMEKWFGTDNYEIYKEYFIKMIRAEIASTYPRLSNIGFNEQNNQIDNDGNYIAQGVVQIKRTKINTDGSTGGEIFLDYLPYEEFKALKNGDDSGKNPLNYFSFEKGLIYYYTYQATVTQVDDGEPTVTYSYLEQSEAYKALTSMCSMPYNFTFSLLQKSGNPEWVMAVIDLLLEEENNEVVLMIQDQLSVTIDTQVDAQVKETDSEIYEYVEVEIEKEVEDENSEGGKKTITEIVGDWHYVDGGASFKFPINEVTTVTTTYTNTSNVFIQKAYTWCINFEQKAEINPTAPVTGDPVEYNYNETPERNVTFPEQSEFVSSVSNGNYLTNYYERYSNEYLLYYTKTDYVSYTYSQSTVTEKRINYEKFLGTLKNDTGRYYVGSRYNEDGKEIYYKEPDSNKEILNAANQICDGNGQTINRLLNYLELHEDTQMHEQLMMYFWNIYTNSNIYDVDIEGLVVLFNTNTLSAVHGTTLVNYIKAWENHSLWQYETKMSSQFPTGYLSEDGTSYIVYEDGSAGHNNISYGLATFITNSNNIKANHPEYGEGYYNWQEQFMQYGFDVTALKTGDLVPVDVANAVYEVVLSGFENKVDTYLSSHGIQLEKTQRDALVNVCYQYGNINGFAEAYQSSIDSEGKIDADLIRENFVLTSNNGSTPFKYRSMTNDRKYANWYLFTQGIYIDRSGNIIKAFGGTILECAKQIHDYMSDPAHLYYYCIGGRETEAYKHLSENLSHGLNTSFEASQVPGNNGYRLTCCATYVSWVLDVAGYLDTPTHSATLLNSHLRNLGWIEINSFSELEPGDIVFMDTVGVNNRVIEHVQIYVGDGTWYNAGGNWSIQQVEPYYSVETPMQQFIFALRAPN